MRICYNKLQKLMIDNQMKRQDLMRAADISSYTATKINKNEPVSLRVFDQNEFLHDGNRFRGYADLSST